MQTSLRGRAVFIAILLSFTLMLSCNSGTKGNDGPVNLETEADKISYSIGVQIGQNFKDNMIDINSVILARAIEDVINGNGTAMTDEEMAAVMNKFQTEMMAKRQEQMMTDQIENRQKASAFLAENALKAGVTTLPDSLQYEVIQDGSGKSPKETDKVKVHYRGTLLDGTEFDSSYARNQPAEFVLQGVIKGWTESLMLMKPGAKWKVYIPPELGYGERGYPPNIPANSLLIFEIELLEIVE
ncbi:FKBP-type peptidyl-prolyl cis-trans isomerase [Candidatus Latescibacterota bacterium]